MANQIRSFIAVDFENPSIETEIQKIQNNLPKRGIKTVNPSIVHFTLLFLGNITTSQVQTIQAKLEQIKMSSFEIELHSIGMFPSARRPRVIWIGVSKGNQQLINLANAISTKLKPEGFSLKRKYTPHLTIARVKRSSKEVTSNLRKIQHMNKSKTFGTIQVNSFALKKSTLTPEGPIYEDLMRFTLHGT